MEVSERPRLPHRPTAFPLRLAALLAAGLLASAEGDCRASKRVALSFRYGANASGHQRVNARLEQPSKNTAWQLDFDVGCSAGQEDSLVLTLALSGEPTGALAPCRGCVKTQLPTQPEEKEERHIPVTNCSGQVTPEQVPKKPPEDFRFFPGQGFIRPSRGFVQWDEANATCTALGATLAMPTSLQEAQALVKVLNYGSSGSSALWAWIGATDHVQEGSWILVTGVPLSQMGLHKWDLGAPEPNGGRLENCMVVQKDTGHIGDAPCDWNLAYGCQIKL